MSMKITSPHFSIHTLTEGVHAAIATNGGAAIANSGIIDLGEQTVIFDTFMTLKAALDLSRAAEALTGRKAETIINSHYHNDHTWGNQIFSPHAKIITSSQTEALLETEGMEELRWARDVSAERLDDFEKQHKTAKNEQEREEARMWIGYYQGLVTDVPRIRIHYPDITFDHKLSMHGSSRSLNLISFENAHTAHDLILYLPDDGIIFMSDLLFVGCHPYLVEGDTDQLLSALEQIQALDAESYVPGHGPVGTRQDLHLMTEYVRFCNDKAKELANKEATPEEIANEKLPKEFSAWELSRFFHINLQALAAKYAEEK